jgi:hypothetical protein
VVTNRKQDCFEDALRCATIRKVKQLREEEISIWAEVDPEQLTQERTFVTVGTEDSWKRP